MIQSMTGFGEAQLEEDGHAYHVELRSVNHRYFKASLHLPDEFAFLEPVLEQLLRTRLSRGSITLRLNQRDLSAAAAQNLNLAALRHYLAQLQQIQGAGAPLSIDLATLALMPGVCQPHELSDEQRSRAAQTIERAARAALDRLIQMRRTEGCALAEDLRKHCAAIREQSTAIRRRVPSVLDEYRQRLTARVQQLIAESNVSLAADDLLKEVAIFAERSDINEELSRLGSHLEQFEAALSRTDPAGRTLDFIGQEMLREANTMGSKAGDAEIARRIIEIKTAIDRIKEQVQNVE